jgi:hypothetical protein
LKLNIGCGQRKLLGYVNVDNEPGVDPDFLLDVSRETWPWGDSTVEAVEASHVMEHIAPGEPFFHFMRELYRVCQPGAEVEVTLPHPSHDLFLNDPTHRQPIMPGTLAMFNRRHVEALAARGDMLTPFYKFIGVDFDFQTVRYVFDPSIDKDDPNLERRMMHERNVIFTWSATLTVVK